MTPFTSINQYADKHPYNCPACGRMVKQRKRGRCTICNTLIECSRWKTGENKHRMWVYHSGHVNDIIDHCESKIREVRFDPTFVFTDRDTVQIAMATVLLNKCGREHDIAFHVVEAFFNWGIAKEYRLWPKMKDVIGLQSIMRRGGSFNSALSYARKQARVERAEPIEQISTLEPVYAGAE